jgi:hypothetical protein
LLLVSSGAGLKRWTSPIAALIARMIILMLALAVSCAPFCSQAQCAHSCCANSAGHCNSGTQHNPTVACERRTELPALATSHTWFAPDLTGTRLAALTEVPSSLRQREGAPSASAPRPPLRV